MVRFDPPVHIYTVVDPLRHFLDFAKSLANLIGTPLNKLLIASTKLRLLAQFDKQIVIVKELPTVNLLKKLGFSDSIVAKFFHSGIFMIVSVVFVSFIIENVLSLRALALIGKCFQLQALFPLLLAFGFVFHSGVTKMQRKDRCQKDFEVALQILHGKDANISEKAKEI
ncbi:hypothetical protein Fmac_025469 [Flemingia macrophylla]|uniref:Uncharacterized protein n=1 Tax=Flemingia macrophylla TaxID=520843 RepID=A0ABD1LSA7_9FABA